MVKQLGCWRSTDQSGASDYIGATPRAGATLRQITEAPRQDIHIWLPARARTADAAPRRLRDEAQDPELSRRRSPADQDPIGARLMPGDQLTVGEDCGEDGFSLQRSGTRDNVFEQEDPPGAATTLTPAARKIGADLLRNLR
jgi:hypothetical protein